MIVIRLVAGGQHLSLQEEAQNNTECHQGSSSTSALRHSQIRFVSTLAPKPNSSEQQAKSTSGILHDDGNAPTRNHQTVLGQSMSTMELGEIAAPIDSDTTRGILLTQECAQTPKRSRSDSPFCPNGFFVDTMGSTTQIKTGFPQPVIKCAASIGSESDEEIILFKGRDRSPGQEHSPFVATDHLHQRQPSPRLSQTVTKTKRSQHSTFSALRSTRVIYDDVPDAESSNQQEVKSTIDFSDRSLKGSLLKPKRRRRQRTTCKLQTTNEEDIMADYIFNSHYNTELADSTSNQNIFDPAIGDSNTDAWQDVDDTDQTKRGDSSDYNKSGGDSEDLGDLDKLSTSDEILDTVDHVLSKRQRPGGTQYLVIWEGHTIDDARWIPIDCLQMPGAMRKVRRYESKQISLKLHDRHVEELPEGAKMGVRLMDLEDKLDEHLDEELFDERQEMEMADGRIARLFAKQEELGLGSDELIIFDGAGNSTDENQDSDIEILMQSTASHVPVYNKQIAIAQDALGCADATEAGLDEYSCDDIEIVHQSRRSSRKTSNGPRCRMSFDPSDEDLEFSMKAAWDNDRNKKKLRKQQREVLRAQGLLVKNKKKLELKAKYKQGMTMDDVQFEIRKFLDSTYERFDWSLNSLGLAG